MFLRATLADGSQVVSEFSKLGHPQRYASQVFGRQKPFNAWRIKGDTHPHNGERILLRERVMVNGDHIRQIEEVEPTVEDHGLDPANFQPVTVMQKGPRGLFTVPDPAPQDDLVVGAKYPVHRDVNNFRDYVLVRAAQPAEDGEGEGEPEVRYYIDGRGENAPVNAPYSESTGPGSDGWEDEDRWDGEDGF